MKASVSQKTPSEMGWTIQDFLLMNAPQFQGPMGGMGQSRDGRLGDRRDGRDGGRGGRGGRKCRLHYSTLSEVYMMVKLESITLVLVFQAQQA